MTEQHWDPVRYARNAGFVAELGMPVVEWLAPQPGERILDLGCGDGALTEKLVRLGCDVVGVDASPEQVHAAVAKGLNAEVMRCEELTFRNEFDGVFTNAVLHWVKNADGAIAAVQRSLRNGGRFVGEFGGFGNVSTVLAAITASLAERGISAAALNPWYFPTVEEYREKLQAGGFQVERIELFPRPTPLPGSLIDWLETFGEPFLGGLSVAEQRDVRSDVQERSRPFLCNRNGQWSVDYVRLRFAARLKTER